MPLHFFKRDGWWLPELGRFETASQRKAASECAFRDMQRTAWGRVSLVLPCLPWLCFVPTVETWLGDKWAVTLVALVLLAFATMAVRRSKMRALLRKQLESVQHSSCSDGSGND